MRYVNVWGGGHLIQLNTYTQNINIRLLFINWSLQLDGTVFWFLYLCSHIEYKRLYTMYKELQTLLRSAKASMTFQNLRMSVYTQYANEEQGSILK